MAVGISAERARHLGTMVWYGLLAAGVTSVAAIFGLRWISRSKAKGLESRPDPATGYAEALERLDQLKALDDDAVNPVCLSRGQESSRSRIGRMLDCRPSP